MCTKFITHEGVGLFVYWDVLSSVMCGPNEYVEFPCTEVPNVCLVDQGCRFFSLYPSDIFHNFPTNGCKMMQEDLSKMGLFGCFVDLGQEIGLQGSLCKNKVYEKFTIRMRPILLLNSSRVPKIVILFSWIKFSKIKGTLMYYRQITITTL